jgi:small subunit ribosomal protein S5
MRAVFETLGIQDIVAKSIGTSNPHNMIKATFDAFSSMSSPRNIANKRGRKVAEIYGNESKLNKDDVVQEELVKTE